MELLIFAFIKILANVNIFNIKTLTININIKFRLINVN